MKILVKHSYVVCLLALLMFTAQSCKKKSDPAPAGTSISHPDLLNTWKVSKVLEGSIDVTTAFDAYRITFADDGTNKTYTLIDRQGTTTEGAWAIDTGSTEITLSPTGGATVVKLTGVKIAADKLEYVGSTTGKTGQVSLSFTLIPAQ